MRLLLIILITLTSPFCLYGEDKPTVGKFDLRTQTDADGNKYYLVFCARPHSMDQKTPGHAWVMWCQQNEQKKQSINDNAFGWWPVDGKGKFSIVDVPGKLVDELKDEKKQVDHFKLSHRLIVQVNKQKYDATLNIARKWKVSDMDYNLLLNSCKNFLDAVAKEAGLPKYDTDPLDWPEPH